MHRREVQDVPAAEFGEVDNYNRLAAGIAKSLPGQRRLLPLRAGQRTDVESDPAVSAISPIDPLLFRTQQVGCFDVLQDLEFKILLAVQIPRLLQMRVVVDFASQFPTMPVPALAKVHCAPNIDLPVPLAAYPVHPWGARNGGNWRCCSHSKR